MKRSVFLIFGLMLFGACGARALGPVDPAVAASFTWGTDEAAAIAAAKQSGKRLIVDFAADWCAPCVEMDRRTFSNPAVRTVLGMRYVGLRFDVTEQNAADLALGEKYRVPVLPQIIVLSADGKELFRIDRFMAPEPFLEMLNSH